MSKTGEIPYTWEEIEKGIKDAIRCQASILERFGPSAEKPHLAADFLGLTYDPQMDMEDLPEFDISRHALHQIVQRAYQYAYQLDGWWDCGSDIWHEVDGALQGYPQTDADGERSPFCTLNDFPLRRMLETFFARFSLFEKHLDLDTRALSLLANMTVPAVRTSLSKEGFKLVRMQTMVPDRADEKTFYLKASDALTWLSRRRGFIPQRQHSQGDGLQDDIVRLLSNEALGFPERIAQTTKLLGYDITTMAEHAGVEVDWLLGLIEGKPVSPDVKALCALAKSFGIAEPDFTGAGVRHLLAADLEG
ncbi:hypothetical protein [Donghicola eburneus]|uniref:hypothetical protein n=1 Tax=Donghicola eburneus TaxID=393278 RepID=UPI0008E29754|nr:hypothetical protein [Donghicola eburneus]SFQ77749.1 hypothetical protein SAMN05421764_12014 [Donghicola eburneus]